MNRCGECAEGHTNNCLVGVYRTVHDVSGYVMADTVGLTLVIRCAERFPEQCQPPIPYGNNLLVK